MRRDEALRLLKEHRAELESMGVTSLALFGSVARDEAGPDSDVDVIIDVRRPFGLFDLARVHLRLEEILGCKVDVLTEGSLLPRDHGVIDKDRVHVTP
jgi:predicted nucleotidyltransferase